MPIKSPINVESCPRCTKPIKAGAYVETFGPPTGGRLVYAHHGCKPYTPPAPIPPMPFRNSKPARAEPADENVLPADPEHQYGRVGDEFDRLGHGGDAEAPSGAPDGCGDDAEAKEMPDENPAEDFGDGPDEKPPLPSGDDEMFERIVEAASERAKEKLASKSTQVIAGAARAAMDKAEQRMDEFIGELTDTVAAKVTQGVNESVSEKLAETVQQAEEIFQQKMDELRAMAPVEHHIHVLDTVTEFPETEVFHYAFHECLLLLANGFNTFLPGPTGCGKTYMAEQLARALQLPYGMISGSAGVTETHLFGTSYPNVTTGENVYHASEFVTLYENGGLFLVDEMDAIDPNCLLALNAAIENGYCTIPRRSDKPRAVRHAKFRLIAGANTFGHGADRVYCGRNKLDEATIERFRAGTVPMDYDPHIERHVCPDADLYRILTAWREKISDKGYQRILSTRFCARAHTLKSLGYSVENIAAKLSGGWAKKEIHDVFGFPPVEFSKKR